MCVWRHYYFVRISPILHLINNKLQTLNYRWITCHTPGKWLIIEDHTVFILFVHASSICLTEKILLGMDISLVLAQFNPSLALWQTLASTWWPTLRVNQSFAQLAFETVPYQPVSSFSQSAFMSGSLAPLPKATDLPVSKHHPVAPHQAWLSQAFEGDAGLAKIFIGFLGTAPTCRPHHIPPSLHP